jgi:nucleotide-binding universal stress UspA family protein
MKRILVATDGSDHALSAAQLAAELAAGMGAELHVLAVAHHDRSEEDELRKFAKIEHLEGGIGNAALEIAKGHVEHVQRAAKASGAKTIKTAVGSGDATEEIIAYIKNNAVDAIVVGRRGRSRIAGLLLGSVSQKLATLAPCIVIICP